MKEFKITFKKVEAGYYKLFLNGVEMLQCEKGLYAWYYTGATATDEYYKFLESVPRNHKWLIDTEGTYFTKSEIKQCWESLGRFM